MFCFRVLSTNSSGDISTNRRAEYELVRAALTNQHPGSFTVSRKPARQYRVATSGRHWLFYSITPATDLANSIHSVELKPEITMADNDVDVNEELLDYEDEPETEVADGEAAGGEWNV